MSPIRIGAFLLLVFALSGCMISNKPAVMGMTATPVLVTAPPTPPALATDGWQMLSPGLEIRTYTPQDNALKQLLALRIDPALYMFRAHYRPGEAYSLRQGRDALPGVAALVNANFFHADHTITGMLVTDGVVYGASYDGLGGMFQVQNGLPRLRSLIAEPYGGELLEQAVQAFPMLVLNGAPVYASSGTDRPTRRTVVATDSAGRVIVMVTPGVGLTLEELSVYLASTDMGLVNALNLDGGGSTMMLLGAGASPREIPSFDPVPAVLAVYPR